MTDKLPGGYDPLSELADRFSVEPLQLRPSAEIGLAGGGSGSGGPSRGTLARLIIQHADPETFNAMLNGKRVGQMNITTGRAAPYATSTVVDPAARRQGVATALYDAAEKVLGRRLIPSPLGLSDDAMAFWKKRLSAMDDKQALLHEMVTVGRDAGVPKSSRERANRLGYYDPLAE